MIYLIRKASSANSIGELEVNTMEDLRGVSLKHSKFIIDFDKMIITIYDDYVE